MRFFLLPVILIGLVGSAPTPASLGAQRPAMQQNLGSHHYSVNASAESQRYFDQGLRLFWAFNHAEAIRSFRAAERLDSTCAMCAFGIALSYGPNINMSMTRVAAESALAATKRARSRVTDPSEVDLIDAIAERYASTDSSTRARQDTAYARALRRAITRSPRNIEVRVLYADALMNLSPWNYWHPDGSMRPGTRVILAQLDTALKADPDHPGACHLYIHAVEARFPERAIRCAERLAKLMPGAGHIVHMPAHIYIRTGRYADAVEVNRHAVHVDHEAFDMPGAPRRGIYPSGYMPHNHHFLAFTASMMGASRLAIEQAFMAASAVDPAVAAEAPWVESIMPIGYQTLVTFGQWDRILAEPPPAPERHFASGMAFYARGVAFAAKRRWAEANAALDSVGRIAADFPTGDNKVALLIAERALAGEIDLRRGAFSGAVRSFQSAVVLEDGLPYNEPPTWYYPMRHSLGKALVLSGRFAEAEAVYRLDLERFPENGWSLYGLWQALRGAGRTKEAAEVLKRFNRAWSKADVKLEASRF
jgi:tetratricopeptide (TPR) repeat protein